MSSDRLAHYAALLLLDWLNQRFDVRFQLGDAPDPEPVEGFLATDGGHRIGLYTAPLWEEEPAWQERLRAAEQRLDASGVPGAFLLWLPPGADVPLDEPDASDFAERVGAAAASLPPGGRTEVTFPVPLKLAKMREEAGYASVVGALSRWWTRITEKVDGTWYVDSSAVHRLTQDGQAREQLWDNIGRLSYSVQVGEAVDFEIDEAWTLQRLSESEAEAGPALSGVEGFALVGAPPGSDPTEGFLVRRTARRRLAAANKALGALDAELRAVGLIGSYEYAEVETAGATVKALDPSLYGRLQVVCILVDGEVRPVFLPRALPWTQRHIRQAGNLSED